MYFYAYFSFGETEMSMINFRTMKRVLNCAVILESFAKYVHEHFRNIPEKKPTRPFRKLQINRSKLIHIKFNPILTNEAQLPFFVEIIDVFCGIVTSFSRFDVPP
jgi:hypothetical protein